MAMASKRKHEAAAGDLDSRSEASGALVRTSKRCAKEEHSVPDEFFLLYSLPRDYTVRTCALCQGLSIDMCPFQGHQGVKAWHPFLPWAQGTFKAPQGNVCRICAYCFAHGGFGTEHKSIKVYLSVMKGNPTLHQEFLGSREKYIALKLENPGLVLRSSKAIYPPRLLQVSDDATDALEAPKEHPA